ncbi:helix-turn-helix domain-containing protein [Ammoniphilus sp. YIM 78166]|uniref:helix-turn-helix domain-containing protein n=1 Tax=Ammoniphilus sp. YIM 78166 TaxID=1644106 RepID=UPI00106F6CE6|nr:helix-turn-helix domain-containing protein [Ammoniphilus sp. YIM 78166]
MRLLIADRDSMERTGLEWLITSYSMRFSEIRQSGDMAALIKELEEYQPDILIVELEMIPSGSWDIFIRAAERYAGAIIALTAEAVFERAWQAIQLQATGLLIKPLSPDRIRQTLTAVVRNKRKKEGERAGSEKETLQHLYPSLFYDTDVPLSEGMGMMVVHPEDREEIRELAEWMENYSFVQQAHILPLREHIVCLLPAYTSEMLYQEAQRLVREALGRTGSKLFIALSPIGHPSNSIHTCYERALQAVKMIFFKGHQQIVLIQEVPVFLDMDPFLTPAEQRVWMAMLEEGDKVAIKRWLYEQFTEFPEGFPEPELLRIRLTSILAHLRRFMQTYQLEKIPQVEIRYQEIFQTILHVPVLFRIVQEILLFIYDILQEASNQKEHAHGDFIERGLRYIDEHFHRSDLSLEEVANYVQRSPSYFSHMLSVKRAQTFRQYVTDVRMKQAKHLLSTSSLTVREVSFAVGYDDPNYFSRLFKEYTGCSPRAWRQK